VKFGSVRTERKWLSAIYAAIVPGGSKKLTLHEDEIRKLPNPTSNYSHGMMEKIIVAKNVEVG
jgi:hypothetical protein